jgi:hypothetical protein
MRLLHRRDVLLPAERAEQSRRRRPSLYGLHVRHFEQHKVSVQRGVAHGVFGKGNDQVRFELAGSHDNCRTGEEFMKEKLVNAGYMNAAYAASLAEFGTPCYLERSGGWLLERKIPGTEYCDAMGPYPLFCCQDWLELGCDLSDAASKWVSVTLVSDPFGKHTPELLEQCFTQVTLYKHHFCADLSRPLHAIVKASHRATVRRALRKTEVRVCERPMDHLESWIELFANLVKRHNISGLRAFSRLAFETQLAVPGMVMFEAVSEGQTVGLDLWYLQSDIAYGHLAAFSDIGYKVRASYATKWHAIQYFYDKARYMDFTAAPDVEANGADGLTAFKQGWSTETRPVYLCGLIANPDAYHRLSTSFVSTDSAYFPLYRKGEFS